MIKNQEQVNFFKTIAKDQFLLMAINEFGNSIIEKVFKLTDGITEIYRQLDYNSFEHVVICVSANAEKVLHTYDKDLKNDFSSVNIFATKSGTSILIEINENGSFTTIMDVTIDIDHIKHRGVVYSYTKNNDEELIYTCNKSSKLTPIPGADTYFSIQTFKSLDTALEQYAIKRALYSECNFLKEAWLDENRIFFKPSPESLLRDSLTDFLKITFREEVRPEQIVDTSHPVDIKVTWQMVNRIALIEIKWLGKSLPVLGDNFSSTYTDNRARSGAQQLSEYLEANKIQTPDKNSKGYLVVFDARRWQTNKHTNSINNHNGNYYRNKEIIYDPKFDELRSDFAKPIRFFMEPKISING